MGKVKGKAIQKKIALLRKEGVKIVDGKVTSSALYPSKSL